VFWRSEKAVQVNIDIIRAFVKLRQLLATSRELARKVQEHDQKITILVDAVQKLLAPPDPRRNTPSVCSPERLTRKQDRGRGVASKIRRGAWKMLP
jgi:translation elongation factor EF-Tu-like GTPase